MTPRLMPRAGGLFFFAALSLADLLLTCLLVGDGMGAVYESNPLAAWCLNNHGWPGMAAFKLATVLLAGGCVAGLARHRPAAARRLLALGCAAVAVVVLYSCFLVARTTTLKAEMRAEAERTARLDEQAAQLQRRLASLAPRRGER